MKYNPSDSSRRRFLKTSLGAAVAGPQIVRAETLGNKNAAGANSRLGIGFIGVGQISQGHMVSFAGMKDVQPIAICDVRQSALQNAEKKLADRGHKGLQATSKYEEVISNPDIDVVCVTTPDHWHAAIALEAMKAGKDVYVEKPMTLTIEEGQKMVEAEKKYGRIVQVGSQQRSSVHFRIAANLVRNGLIGDIKEVYCRLGSFPQPPEKEKIVPVPEGFDYERWLGPTPCYE